MRPLLDLGDLPFHVGPAATPHHADLPDTLPFALGIDDGRVAQMPSGEVARALALAYARGSMIGTPLAAVGIGRAYADDFLRFLEPWSPAGARVLEIGAGTGYLLQRLSARGAVCVGLDPGFDGDADGPILRDRFPSPRVGGPFDAIVHYCVLEHVEDPVAFLRAQVEVLAAGGRVLLAVPDAEPGLAAGDVSTFVHEHWSYFTASSLARVLAAAGLRVQRLERSRYGGLLYVEAAVGHAALSAPADHAAGDGLADRIRRHVEDARQWFDTGGTVGGWPAVRLLNLVHLLRPAECPRLFDDDPRLRGRYFPPLPQAIESCEGLFDQPVDRLVLASRAFGPAMRARLDGDPRMQRTRLVSWRSSATRPA